MPPYIQVRQPPDDSWVTFDLGNGPQVIQVRQPPGFQWTPFTIGQAGHLLTGTRAERLAYTSAAYELGSFWFETDTLETWVVIVTGAPAVTIWQRVLTTYSDETTAPVDLDADLAPPGAMVLANTMPPLGLNRIYSGLLGVRVEQYLDAAHGTNGSLDISVCFSIATDGAGASTFTFQSVPVPDASLLPLGLFGATCTVAAVALGFRIYATRPVGVHCWAHAEWHISRLRDVT